MRSAFKWFLTIPLIIVLLSVRSSSPARADASSYDPNVLSYGMYWFGKDNASQKFVHGQSNPYFDPAKPTLIWVHGWQPDLSATYPPNFIYNNSYDCASNSGFVNTANAWIDGGWNVGIFYWNQFSDEPEERRWAEAKVWTPDGPKKMRWRKGDGSYVEAPSGTPSAAELFYQAYVAAMTEYDYTGGNIRIAGHSLGGQMAARLTKLIHDGIAAGTVPSYLRPTRVVLLDPYWSPEAKDYLGGKKTGQVTREYIAELLPTGTLFEWYWSSTLTSDPSLADPNDALKPMVMYAAMDPAYITLDPTGMKKHCAAYHLYFWSYAFAGPGECSGDGCLGTHKLLAKMSDDRLAAQMRSDYTWSQNAGTTTATPDDDTYQSAARSDVPYTVTQLQTGTTTPKAGCTVTVTATVTNDSGAANYGTLVTFDTDLGTISARSAVSDGVAIGNITSNIAGTAHISATTKGAGNTVQSTATVTFTSAQQYTWDGGGTTNDWSEAANWSPNGVPQCLDTVTFDALSNKDVHVDTDFAGTIDDLTIQADYTGAITQYADLTIGGDFTQNGGTFSGGSSTLRIKGHFTKAGGTFTAPGGSLNISGGFAHTGGTFTANGGTVSFIGDGAPTLSGATTFYNLTANNTSASQKVDASGSTLVVENLLRVQDGTFKSASDLHDVQVDSVGTLELNGDIAVSGDWTHDGAFTHNNHAVTFDGSGTQTLEAEAITFYDLTVNSGSTLVDLAEFSVDGTLTNNGSLRQTKDAPNGSTTQFLRILNQAGDTTKYYGVDINPSTGDMGSTTVTIGGNQDCTTDNTSQPVRRCFDIAPGTNQTAAVTFWYLEGERNYNTAANVKVFHWESSAWQQETGTYTRSDDGVNYSVKVTGVDSYSPFILDDSANPTAITLLSFQARPVADLTGFGNLSEPALSAPLSSVEGLPKGLGTLALVVLGAIGGALLWRSRRA